MKIRKVFAGVVLLLTVSAIVHAQSQTQAQSKSGSSLYERHKKRVLTKPKDDMALLYFMRSSSSGYAIKFWIFADKEVLSVLRGSSYTYAHLKPGNYLFWAKAENVESYPLEVKAGKTYYFKAEPQWGTWKARISFFPMPEDQAKAELIKCKHYITLTEKGRIRGMKIAEKHFTKAEEESGTIEDKEFYEEFSYEEEVEQEQLRE